ncbi:tetratricopeptide repeat protein [Nostoc sp.]|uniref:tetratricopeptide repeat protein n=1 Tax=Nostoc sp. TaxID=1180 RepID=UPI002FF682FC
MLEIGALLFGTALFGGNVAGTMVSGVLGNRADEYLCRLFGTLRDCTFKATPKNHDLQKALLTALRDGIQTTTTKQLKILSSSERRQVQEWLKQVVKDINLLIDDVDSGNLQWNISKDWGILLKATPAELKRLKKEQVNSELQQLKTKLEQSFHFDTLPDTFRIEFESKWLSCVSEHLAEEIKKPNSRVTEILQVELQLDLQDSVQDVQTSVREIIQLLGDPQQFLEAVQQIYGEINTMKQQLDRIEQAVQIYQGIEQQKSKIVSSVKLISEPPTVKKKQWQGRQQEIKQLKELLQEEDVNTIGIQGLSGVGKSWLAAYIYEDEQTRSSFDNIFWADVSQSPDFIVFVQNCLIHLGGKTPEQLEALGEPSQLINDLLRSLKQRSCLLVVDNLETLLDENRHIYQRDYQNFFSSWVNRGATSIILLTTQIQPEIIEEQIQWLFLQGLQTKEGEQLLRSLNIVGSDAELQDFSKCVNGHPKMLWLVAKLLKPGTHIREAEKLGLKQLHALLNQELFPYRELGKVQFVLILEQHWELLTPELKRFFANLSIYRRSFNRDAAALVLAEAQETVTALQTQLALQELTSRSLLDSIEGEQKYQFHPFVFEYAKQKAGKQHDVLREKAIAYYQSMATDKSTWKTLEDVAPHLEIFYQRCEQKHYVQAFDTLSICDEFLDVSGYHSTRAELYEHLVQVWEASDAEKGKLADAFFRLGVAYYYLGYYLKTIEHCQQALLIAREVSDRQVEANTLCWLGRAYHRLRQPQQAIEFNQPSLEIAREIGDAKLEALVLINLGNNFSWLKQYEKAIQFCQQGLDVAKASGNLYEQTIAMNSLGNVYTVQKQYAKAIDCYQQSMQIRQQTGHQARQAYCLGQLGNVYCALKQYQQAIEYYQQSLEVAQQTGYSHGKSVAIAGLGSAYRTMGQYQQAIECYQQLLEIKREMGDSQGEAEALRKLEEIERERSDINSHD